MTAVTVSKQGVFFFRFHFADVDFGIDIFIKKIENIFMRETIKLSV